MTKKENLKIYEDSSIHTIWDSDTGKWYISIFDEISVLTDSENIQVY